MSRADRPQVRSSLSFQGPLAKLVIAPPCHGGGHGSESRRGRSRTHVPRSQYGRIEYAGDPCETVDAYAAEGRNAKAHTDSMRFR